MERRDILKASGIFLGYAVVGGSAIAVINGCKADKSPSWSPSFLTPSNIDLIAEIAERIIPETDTPGAKAAFVHRYIDEAVKNNFTEAQQQRFVKGLDDIEVMSSDKYGEQFSKIKADEMDAILQELADGKDSNDEETKKRAAIFTTMKNLVVTGYFTSEVGAAQALIHEVNPGPFQGCVPFSDVGGQYAL